VGGSLSTTRAKQRSFEGSATTSAPAERVWAAWTDVGSWPGGVIEAASSNGPFEVGTEITTKVIGYPKGTSRITAIDEPRLWVSVAKGSGFTMTYEHLIEPAGATFRITERAIVSGPLGALVARLLGARLRTTFEATTRRVADLAEEL